MSDKQKVVVVVIRDPDYTTELRVFAPEGIEVHEYVYDWGADFNGPKNASAEQAAEQCEYAVDMARYNPDTIEVAQSILDTFGCHGKLKQATWATGIPPLRHVYVDHDNTPCDGCGYEPPEPCTCRDLSDGCHCSY